MSVAISDGLNPMQHLATYQNTQVIAPRKASGYILLATVLSTLTDASKDDWTLLRGSEYWSHDDLQIEQLVKVISATEEYTHQKSMATVDKSGCICNGFTCQCCKEIKLITLEVCLALTYHPDSKRVIAILTFGSQTVYWTTFLVSNPKVRCFQFLKFNICPEFYDFQVGPESLSGCARLVFSAFRFKVSVTLGCFSNKASQSFFRVVDINTDREKWNRFRYRKEEDFDK